VGRASLKGYIMATKIIRSPKNRNQGRKSLGDKKRVKTSITIPPKLFEKVMNLKNRSGDTISDTCCRLIDIGYAEMQKTLKN